MMTNKELIKLYPFLQIRNIFTNELAPEWVDFTMLDDIPKGWRESFGIKMCEEIKELLIKENKFEEYQVMQIKEKFGELRWYGNYISPELSKILDKYTKLSRFTCMICGNTAKYVDTPYIYPICDRCSETFNTSRLRSVEKYWEEWDE